MFFREYSSVCFFIITVINGDYDDNDDDDNDYDDYDNDNNLCSLHLYLLTF